MANFFKTRRDQLKKSQFQMAVLVGKTTTTVALWEKGNAPRLRDARTLAEAYEVPVKKVIDAIVEMSQQPAASK